ncbi:MAG: hypothetical protein HQ522_08145 [Bacteroidetes bacterium]|nr:hypothetical protein [Bacteroidota bacterium]
MDPKKIYTKLNSKDESILKQSISFIDERILLIRERSKQAESRATSMLTVSGILAGFVVYFAEILNGEKAIENIIVITCYFISILFLIKAVYFAVRVFWVQKGNELTPELIFKLQKKNEVKALKEELKWKIWEYYEILPLTNIKLFRLNRSQRNTVLAIITFMFLGIIQSLKINIDTEITFLYKSTMMVLITVLILSVDSIIEHFGSFWKKKQKKTNISDSPIPSHLPKEVS